MRLPAASSHFSKRVRFGRYVTRRLRRARLTALAVDVEQVTTSLRTLGRALEDADDAIQDAIADRDAADDDLDDGAKDARASLAGRGASADKEPPYTLVFPDGVGYYTAAPLDQEVQRYGELKLRLEEHLPGNDKVRNKTVALIVAGLEGFSAASAELAKARTADALASTRLTAATEAWERQMEKTYGALLTQVGKAKAERFFPVVRGKKGDGGDAGGPEGAPA